MIIKMFNRIFMTVLVLAILYFLVFPYLLSQPSNFTVIVAVVGVVATIYFGFRSIAKLIEKEMK